MKPNFALSLSFDGIALLARAPQGWQVLDEVSIRSADLKAELAALRDCALAAGPDGDRVKLVLPEAQIKFLKVPDSGARGAALQDRLMRALTGATPYEPHELVFDWAIVGDEIQVAAVARETLVEAEVFTSAHHFVPVCFVAYAPNDFDGEVFFGAARSWDGPFPERDEDNFVIIPTAPAEALQVEPDEENPPADDAADTPGQEDLASLPEDDLPLADVTEGASDLPPVQIEDTEDADVDERAEPDAPTDVAQETTAPAEPASFADTLESLAPGLIDAAEATSSDQSKAPVADASSNDAETAPATDPQEETEPRDADAADEPGDAFPDVGAAAATIPDAPETSATGDVAPEAADFPASEDPAPNADDEAQAAQTPESDEAPRATPAFSSRRRDGSPRPPLPPRRSDPVFATRPTAGDPNTPPAFASVRARLSDEPADTATAAPRLGSAESSAPPVFKSKPRSTSQPLQDRPNPFPDITPEPEPPRRGLFGRRAKPVEDPPAPQDAPLPDPAPAAEPTPETDASEDAPKPRRRFGILPGKNKPKRISTTALDATKPEELPPLDEDPDIPPMPSADDPREKAAEERNRMTVFGARKPAKPKRQPRFMGLALTLALLLFLAGVAAWASVFLDDGLARFLPANLRGTEVADSTLDLAPDVPGSESDSGVRVASLSPAPDQTQPAPAAVPSESDVLTETEAETHYVATGIWQRAPLQPGLPGSVPLGEVYTTTLDPEIPQPDAVALIDALDHRVDLALKAPLNPLGADVTFDLDDKGLVIATRSGAITPDRVLVFQGRPEVTPPPRPAEAALLSEAPELLALRALMASARPQARPDILAEIKERSELAGLSLAELAAFRPQARAVTDKDLAEEDTIATAQAVRLSPRPIGRPRDIDRIVAAARASQPSPAVATAPRRTVTPVAPSPASVARQATQTNAVNLRRVSLFGIFGTAGERRALVRLSNAEFVRVEVGDTLDGGRVAAISNEELRYVRNGRTIVLKLP